jgi:hypothetical protein
MLGRLVCREWTAESSSLFAYHIKNVLLMFVDYKCSTDEVMRSVELCPNYIMVVCISEQGTEADYYTYFSMIFG